MAGIARQPIGAISVAGVPIATSNPADATGPYVFPAGSFTFSPPADGYWKLVGWGGGQRGDGGRSGSYVEKTVYLRTTDQVSLAIGGADFNTTFSSAAFATVTANGGSAGGIASGGDVNLNGSAGGSAGGPGTDGLGTGGGLAGLGNGVNNGGGGAPAMLPYRGGKGGTGSSAPGCHPAGGGEIPGDGMAVLSFVRS